jgi:hypothetical protein
MSSEEVAAKLLGKRWYPEGEVWKIRKLRDGIGWGVVMPNSEIEWFASLWGSDGLEKFRWDMHTKVKP